MPFPCTLHREEALVGSELAQRLGTSSNGGLSAEEQEMESPDNTMSEAVGRLHIEAGKVVLLGSVDSGLSRFERLFFASYEPVLQSLLSQLPTRSLFDLFHTSRHIRRFLANYPLAWRTLSFRLPQPPPVLGPQGAESPEAKERNSRLQVLNGFLVHVVVPFSTRLTHLDLCNTAVDGIALCANVWSPRKSTLKHLSVRGCKNVSIKYHIVPFLRNNNPKGNPWIAKSDLALTSLYTYRCRHHRRRPYLPSSLVRRDSDSEPTHDLIELCHEMGIWTDTAWCPTPGPRCFRRRDYHGNRAAPGTAEVWVPFDRLWRSQNRLGPVDDARPPDANDGRLWEVTEAGADGEPLRGLAGNSRQEGKDMPAHTRLSHRMFVDEVKCDQCGDAVLERCETCSVRMHCMGCRKTLCASCAFNRPIPRKRHKIRSFQALLNDFLPPSSSSASEPGTVRLSESRRRNKFWWAPGAHRSPNLMSEPAEDDELSDSDDAQPVVPGNANAELKLNMHWCCLEPIFSGGGGIAFLGPGLGGRGAEKVRAAPLPRKKRYADPDFILATGSADAPLAPTSTWVDCSEDLDILPYLKQDNVDLQTLTCPRSLCQDCYRMPRWKVNCRGCRRPLCKEHDFRGLKVRKCGYRDLSEERKFIRSRSPPKNLVIPPFRAQTPKSKALAFDSPSEMSESSDVAPSMSRQDSASTTTTIVGLATVVTSTTKATFDIERRGASSPAPSGSLAPTLPRHRSHSFSGVRPRTSIAEHLSTMVQTALSPSGRVPLPGRPHHPVQWMGCGEYFCQALRPIGDNRARCSESMKHCSHCRVWVCSVCLSNNEPCKCTMCLANYLCPHCAELPANKAKCRRKEEAEARAAAELARKQLRDMQAEFAKRAEQAAEMVNDFFKGLSQDVSSDQEGETEAPAGQSVELTDTEESHPLTAEQPVNLPQTEAQAEFTTFANALIAAGSYVAAPPQTGAQAGVDTDDSGEVFAELAGQATAGAEEEEDFIDFGDLIDVLVTGHSEGAI